MKRIVTGCCAGAAILLMSGCATDSSPSNQAAATVTTSMVTTARETITSQATVQRTTTAVRTATATITAEPQKPDAKAAKACRQVGVALAAVKLTDPLERLIAGESVSGLDVVDPAGSYQAVSTDGLGEELAFRIGDLNGELESLGATQEWDQESAEDIAFAYRTVSRLCDEEQSPVDGIVVVTSTATVTATEKVAGDGSPAKTIKNGTYLVPGEITPGVYKCSDVGDEDFIYTVSKTKDGEIIDNDTTSLARVPASAFSMTLSRCAGDWVFVE